MFVTLSWTHFLAMFFVIISVIIDQITKICVFSPLNIAIFRFFLFYFLMKIQESSNFTHHKLRMQRKQKKS